MQFREATLADKEQVEALWDCCFEKREEPFFKFYFSKYCWQENQVLGAFAEGGKLQCMLHLNPYRMRLREQEEKVPYIVGVATAPAARGQHLMGELLQYALEQVRQQGVNFVTLMPIYAGIYTPYQFAFCYERAKYSWEAGKLALPSLAEEQRLTLSTYAAAPTESLIKRLEKIYNEGVLHLDGVPQRDTAAWQKLLGAAEGDKVQVTFAQEEGQDIAYMFSSVQKGKLEISELVDLQELGKYALLHYADSLQLAPKVEWLDKAWDKTYLFLQDASQSPQKLPFMMARCVNVLGAWQSLVKTIGASDDADNLYSCFFMTAFGLHKRHLAVRVEDKLLPENNLTVQLDLLTPHTMQITVTDAPAEVTMDVAAFTQLYFGTASSFELANRGQLQVPAEAKGEYLQYMYELFSPQLTWNNEYF